MLLDSYSSVHVRARTLACMPPRSRPRSFSSPALLQALIWHVNVAPSVLPSLCPYTLQLHLNCLWDVWCKLASISCFWWIWPGVNDPLWPHRRSTNTGRETSGKIVALKYSPTAHTQRRRGQSNHARHICPSAYDLCFTKAFSSD